MDKKGRNFKTAAVVGTAALAVITLLIVIFLCSAKNSKHQGIVLPDPDSGLSQSDKPDAPAENFATISTQNVQDILATLWRPSSYHQTLTLTTLFGEAAREQRAELWVSGTQALVNLRDETESRTCMTDGRTLYVWYADSEQYAEFPHTSDMLTDDLAGLPTYETVLRLQPHQITGADFVTLPEAGEMQFVFVSCSYDDLQHHFWVSLDSGLLYKYIALSGDEPVYTVQQTALERLVDGDEVFSDVFVLPDGTHPFVKEE